MVLELPRTAPSCSVSLSTMALKRKGGLGVRVPAKIAGRGWQWAHGYARTLIAVL